MNTWSARFKTLGDFRRIPCVSLQVSWGTAKRPAFGLGVDVKVQAGTRDLLDSVLILLSGCRTIKHSLGKVIYKSGESQKKR